MFGATFQFNSIQSLFPYKKKYTNIKKHQNNKETNMEEKTGRPMRPDYCPSLKKKVTKHPNNHITKPNKTRTQNKGLCSKERNYS